LCGPGSANIPDPAHGSFTFNCFQTNLTTNSLRLQSHTAMFGVAYKFN
jgi:outer membrane immunogenic protein